MSLLFLQIVTFASPCFIPFLHYRALSVSMDSLKFHSTWNSSGVPNAKLPIKVFEKYCHDKSITIWHCWRGFAFVVLPSFSESYKPCKLHPPHIMSTDMQRDLVCSTKFDVSFEYFRSTFLFLVWLLPATKYSININNLIVYKKECKQVMEKVLKQKSSAEKDWNKLPTSQHNAVICAYLFHFDV